jgi:hypothetical protein
MRLTTSSARAANPPLWDGAPSSIGQWQRTYGIWSRSTGRGASRSPLAGPSGSRELYLAHILPRWCVTVEYPVGGKTGLRTDNAGGALRVDAAAAVWRGGGTLAQAHSISTGGVSAQGLTQVLLECPPEAAASWQAVLADGLKAARDGGYCAAAVGVVGCVPRTRGEVRAKGELTHTPRVPRAQVPRCPSAQQPG